MLPNLESQNNVLYNEDISPAKRSAIISGYGRSSPRNEPAFKDDSVAGSPIFLTGKYTPFDDCKAGGHKFDFPKESFQKKPSSKSNIVSLDSPAGFRRSNGGIIHIPDGGDSLWIPGNPPSGAMPPPGGNFVQDGVFYQTGEPSPIEQISSLGFLSNIYKAVITSVKTGLWQFYTDFARIKREFFVERTNGLGWWADLALTTYALGADMASCKSFDTDYKYDKMEMLVAVNKGNRQEREIVAMRMYNTRPDSTLKTFLTEGVRDPREGIDIQKDHLNLVQGGLVTYNLSKCGGRPLEPANVQTDPLFSKSDLNWVSHGHSKKGDIKMDRLQRNLVDSVISYNVYNMEKTKSKYICNHPYTGEEIWAVTPKRTYKLSEWDPQLALFLGARSLADAAFIHIPFSVLKYVGKSLGFDVSSLNQIEADSELKPLRMYRYRKA